uniref:Uncharacterized protein n=1 Tax=Aegilops tauschii subsp. strangulata TaxID=200361 RepID=A0A453RFN0_AEGTS
MAEPHIDIKSSIAFTVFLKAFGGLLFIIISSFGAFILQVSTRIGMAVPHIDVWILSGRLPRYQVCHCLYHVS